MNSDGKPTREKDEGETDHHQQHNHCAPCQPETGAVGGGAIPKLYSGGDPVEDPDEEDVGPPSPGVDVHAVLGVPRAKRPSERSTEEESDSDDVIDSDDDTEEWQEGEYLVIEEDDEELKELQTQVLSENASLSRDILVPIFTACNAAYDKWMSENDTAVTETEVTETEVSGRRTQLQLYKKVLQMYGSDAEWQDLTHAQRVNRNKEAYETSLKAKEIGPPPDSVTEASVAAQKNVADDTFSPQMIEQRLEESMKKLCV